MAIREVRIMGDDILEKQCKPVTKMTMRTKILIEDMLDTMYEKYGVGLAAPQVGVLKQIVVIDVGEGPIVLIMKKWKKWNWKAKVFLQEHSVMRSIILQDICM